jgi:hypothetical protein
VFVRENKKNNVTQPWLQFNPYADIFIIAKEKSPSFIVYVNEQRMGSRELTLILLML